MLSPALRFRAGILLARRWASNATDAMNKQFPYAKIQLKKPESEKVSSIEIPITRAFFTNYSFES